VSTTSQTSPPTSAPEGDVVDPVDAARRTMSPAASSTDAARGRWRRRTRGQSFSPRVALVQFALGGFAVMSLLALVGVLILHNAALEEGVSTAAALAHYQVAYVVEPALTPGLLRGDKDAQDAFDEVVKSRLLFEPGVVRIKLWKLDGTVIYSDDPRLINQRFELDDQDLAPVRTGVPSSTIVDVNSPENILERSSTTDLVQVYSKVTDGDTTLLYEVYYELPTVAGSALTNISKLLPAFVVGLVLLWLLQLPLAWRLVTRLKQSQDDREALHRKVIEASDNERRRIARDLHDGVVQSLAGVSYSLSAVADRLKGVAPADAVTDIGDAAHLTRDGVRELRTLISEIYPPNLEQLGLNAALSHLLDSLAGEGVETRLDLAPQRPLSRDVASVFYRAAQESIRNSVSHSRATTVELILRYDDGSATLTVRDDGVGFDPTAPRDDGRPHFGLLLMGELAAEAGGRAHVESAPGRGTMVVVEVPLR
jgi:signal transduction histidine kinase